MGLDAIELVLAFEEEFAISISDAEAEKLITPCHVIDFTCEKLGIFGGFAPCISMKVFHQIRSGIRTSTGHCRSEIKPRTLLTDLFQNPKRRTQWKQFCKTSPYSPRLFPIGLTLFKRVTVRDLVATITGRRSRATRAGLKRWTRPQIRDSVRSIIREQLGITNFSDNAEFIRDLGCD